MNIVLLGSGNVATHLGRAFKMAGQNIVQVWSRKPENAGELADALAAESISDLAELDESADLYILAVKDEAISTVVKALKLSNQLLVHTSGSVPLSALACASSRTGVFYPLQTFSKQKAVDFRQIPIFIEGVDPDVSANIRSIADRLSEKVIELSSDKRRALHVAAVFACNFTNHLYSISQALLQSQDLDIELLKPLILETASKVLQNDPRQVQTGPAVREDFETINSHAELLSPFPELKDLYEKLSKSIINMHHQSEGLN